MPELCPSCGVELQIGDYPFCPHGRTGAAIVKDEIPGGQFFENGFDTPQKFFSHSEHRAALAARGLTINAKWSGEHDKFLSRMDIPCATTLANAKALLSRTKATRFAPEEAYEPIPIEVSTITFAKER